MTRCEEIVVWLDARYSFLTISSSQHPWSRKLPRSMDAALRGASSDVAPPASPKDATARMVEAPWCKQGSWEMCQKCGSMQPRPLQLVNPFVGWHPPSLKKHAQLAVMENMCRSPTTYHRSCAASSPGFSEPCGPSTSAPSNARSMATGSTAPACGPRSPCKTGSHVFESTMIAHGLPWSTCYRRQQLQSFYDRHCASWTVMEWTCRRTSSLDGTCTESFCLQADGTLVLQKVQGVTVGGAGGMVHHSLVKGGLRRRGFSKGA